MDLSIPIIGVIAFMGYSLNETKTPRNKKEKRDKISPHDTPSGKNIYHSTFSKEITNKEQHIADIQLAKSRYPKQTNIIPPLYNTDCTWGCDKKITEYVIQDDSNKIIKDVEMKPSTIDKAKLLSGPMFSSSGDYSGFSIEAEYSPLNLKEGFSNSLTGGAVDLSHNNMVPHFGTNITQNTDFSKGNQSVLDNYTGSSSLIKPPKKEVSGMFKPQAQQVFGSKTFGDNVSTDRFTPSIYQTNVLPAPQIRVQPLPQEVVRPEFKNVNDLRVLTNPKNEFVKPLTSGKRYITDRGIQSQFDKNRPEKFYKNTPDKYLTTTGANTKNKISENFSNNKFSKKDIIAESHPRVNASYNSENFKGPQRFSKFDEIDDNGIPVSIDLNNRKKETKQDWVRNAKSSTFDSLDDFINRDSYFAPEQERETTSRMDILGERKEVKGTYANITDSPKTTNKEINIFSYSGNSGNYTEKTTDRTQYTNTEITTNRQEISDKKGYVAGRNTKNTILAEIGEVLQRDDTQRNKEFNIFSNKQSYTSQISSLGNFGQNTLDDTKNGLEYDFSSRNIDPALVKVLKNNPIAIEYSYK